METVTALEAPPYRTQLRLEWRAHYQAGVPFGAGGRAGLRLYLARVAARVRRARAAEPDQPTRS
jgi:hypothetical protein